MNNEKKEQVKHDLKNAARNVSHLLARHKDGLSLATLASAAYANFELYSGGYLGNEVDVSIPLNSTNFITDPSQAPAIGTVAGHTIVQLFGTPIIIQGSIPLPDSGVVVFADAATKVISAYDQTMGVVARGLNVFSSNFGWNPVEERLSDGVSVTLKSVSVGINPDGTLSSSAVIGLQAMPPWWVLPAEAAVGAAATLAAIYLLHNHGGKRIKGALDWIGGGFAKKDKGLADAKRPCSDNCKHH